MPGLRLFARRPFCAQMSVRAANNLAKNAAFATSGDRKPALGVGPGEVGVVPQELVEVGHDPTAGYRAGRLREAKQPLTVRFLPGHQVSVRPV